MSKIAFISPVPVFPPSGGNRARQLTLIKALRSLGHEVHFFFLPSRQMGDFDEAAHGAFFGPGRFTSLKRGGLSNAFYYLRRAAAKMRRRIMPEGPPGAPFELSQIDETFYAPFERQLREFAANEGFDTAIVTYALFSRALLAFGASVHKVIDTHDSIRHYIGEIEECKALKRADTIVAIQDQEAELFAAMLRNEDRPRIRILSHLTEVSSVKPAGPCEGATFLGSSFEANRRSIRYFIDEVLPKIRAVEPTFKLFVSGSICRDIEDAPYIIKLGFVDDIRDAFARAPISLNPIVQGTGVKIKLIDSLGMGLPIVSTEFGVLGLPREFLAGVSIIADGDSNTFSAAVLSLYRDADLRAKQGERSLEGAKKWNAQQNAFLRDILAKP